MVDGSGTPTASVVASIVPPWFVPKNSAVRVLVNWNVPLDDTRTPGLVEPPVVMPIWADCPLPVIERRAVEPLMKAPDKRLLLKLVVAAGKTPATPWLRDELTSVLVTSNGLPLGCVKDPPVTLTVMVSNDVGGLRGFV